MTYVITLNGNKREKFDTLEEAVKRVDVLRKIFKYSEVNILVNY